MLYKIKIIDIRDINICVIITILTSMLRYLIQLSIVSILITNVDDRLILLSIKILITLLLQIHLLSISATSPL